MEKKVERKRVKIERYICMYSERERIERCRCMYIARETERVEREKI